MTNPTLRRLRRLSRQDGLTKRHENQSVAARQSRDLFLIFGAADLCQQPQHMWSARRSLALFHARIMQKML